MFLLFESSVGFSLFKVNEWDRIATLTNKLQNDIANY